MKKPQINLPQPLKKPVRLTQVAYTLLLFHLLAVFAWLVVIAPLYLQPDNATQLTDFFATMNFNLAFLLFFIFFGTPVVSLASAWLSRMAKGNSSKPLKWYFWTHAVWFICHCVVLISIAVFSKNYTMTGSGFETFALAYPAILYPLFALKAVVLSILSIRQLGSSK
ncbi:hypothetical protein BH11PAT4_BH11PAT4_0930 [soil metagenome]